jgi:hypothetical protein
MNMRNAHPMELERMGTKGRHRGRGCERTKRGSTGDGALRVRGAERPRGAGKRGNKGGPVRRAAFKRARQGLRVPV